MPSRLVSLTALLLAAFVLLAADARAGDAVVADHQSCDLPSIPPAWIEKAKQDLHIAYGHTSHGSQITTGMQGLARFKGDTYAYRGGGGGGALDLRDRAMKGANDLGNPNRRAWAEATRTYLEAHDDVNVVMWSWCGQAATSTNEIDVYLDLMEGLVKEFPKVTFVFMTGHLDGSGLEGRLHLANEHIRAHCRKHGRVLFDFADIESYDPDGNDYRDKLPNDRCDYDSDGDGRRDSNWAKEWQAAHEEGQDWYKCSSAHSEPLNANRKAYAAWWLFARLAGWAGPGSTGATAEEVGALLDEGIDAERNGRPVDAYVRYRAALARAGDGTYPREIADRLDTVRRDRMRALEKVPAVKAEKKAHTRLVQTLERTGRDLERLVKTAGDTPSGRIAEALRRRLGRIAETGTDDAD